MKTKSKSKSPKKRNNNLNTSLKSNSTNSLDKNDKNLNKKVTSPLKKKENKIIELCPRFENKNVFLETTYKVMKDNISKEKGKDKENEKNKKSKSLLKKRDEIKADELKSKFPELKNVNSDNLSFENLPRNINQYQHLFIDSNVNAADVSWILALRDKPEKKNININNLYPPPCFDKYYSSYIEKINELKNKPPDYIKRERRYNKDYDHILRKNLEGTPSITMTSFISTLRDGRSFSKKQLKNTRFNKWLDNPNQTKSNFYFSTKYTADSKTTSRDFFKKLKVNHPYNETFYKGKKGETFKKKFEQNMNESDFFLGEHLGLDVDKVYKYKNENIQNLRHLFEGRQDNKQSIINWELGLRNTHEYNKKVTKIKEGENNESPTKNAKSTIPKWDTISYEIPKHINYEDLSKIYKLKKNKLQEKRNQLKSQKK